MPSQPPAAAAAFAAAQAVAGTETPAYNPLFIYGGVGLGKTHLLQAIGQVAEGAGKHVIYVTAETFTNEMVAAIRGKTMDEFRSRYRTVDVLLIDDAQFVAGKTSTEEEFYHTFNAVFSRGGKIALASDVHPRSISGLDERIQTFETKLDTVVEQVKDRLPAPAGEVLAQAHDAARTARQQVRDLIAKAA